MGWATAARPDSDLVVEALNRALEGRHPDRVIHPSDHGSVYTRRAFINCCGVTVVRSMGTVGDAYDNAMCESFFATLECELLDRVTFVDHSMARRELFQYIEGWYNTSRRHSALGYLSPVQFETLYYHTATKANNSLSTVRG